jgi:DNA-binding HxlR family transcriptional regulator
MKPQNDRRSVCPVACTLDIVGDKWSLLIIRDLFGGKTSFKDFGNSPEKISTNILTERLTRLCEHGLVDRTEDARHAGRFEYTLSKKGRSLRPLLRAMADWGLKHLPDTQAKMPA